MKKIFLFTTVLTSLFITGCSQDEFTLNGENGDNGNGNTSYLAVNLISSDIGSRGLTNNYEDGTEAESTVTNVRFYFFTENGVAANVKIKGNSYVNYYDWTPQNGDISDDKENDNVTKKLAATIVINTKDGDKLPQMIAAVLNPADKLGDSSRSLGELKEITNDYTKPELTKAGKFVMFNSVYGKNGAEVCAVPIEAKHLAKTEADAKANPVILHVERSVAKVKVTLSKSVGFDEENKLALNDKEGNPIKVDEQQIYLKLNGWSLSADTDNGRLVKNIDPAWTSNWWNVPERYRSSWARNSKSAKNLYHPYDEINTEFTTALYTNENAAKYSEDVVLAQNNTKVIISGTLCKADGTALSLVRHLGAYFADTYDNNVSDNLPNLKTSILAQLKANSHNYYYETEQEGKKVRNQIDTSDLKIVIADQQNKEDSKNNCYVYAQLTDEAKAKTWYDSADGTTPITDAATTINDVLKNKEIIDWALVWKNGMTYYYYEIIHNDSGESNTMGVVRNHVYDTRVTKIAGLGTPVYDPGKNTYPEKPEPNDHFIAAEIRVLSWRIVSNDYELDW